MISIQFSDSIYQEGQTSFYADLLERAAQEVITTLQPGLVTDLTIVLSDDEHLQELNRQFLDIDSPTDVLSFPSDEVDPDSEIPYLGDVIISIQQAQLQAKAIQHPLEDELRLLVVHGVLHLMGYDHAEPEEQETMWALQANILARLGSS
jgi:probable rRNA maturation factor